MSLFYLQGRDPRRTRRRRGFWRVPPGRILSTGRRKTGFWRVNPGVLGLCAHSGAGPWSSAMLGWFRALMPRDERFFDLFAHHSKTVVAGAETLRPILKGAARGPHQNPAITDRAPETDPISRPGPIAPTR